MTRSYAIVQDTRGILWNLNQFWKRSYSIIDKIIYKCLFEQVNAKRNFKKDHVESLSTLENILHDDRLDPMQSKNRVTGALFYQLSYEATHSYILHIISLLTGDMNSIN